VDVATAYLYQLVDGRKNPIVATLMKIARAFDVPVRDRFADGRDLHLPTP
jgi:transcriptional regulator with XRE-family HTH domain